MAIVTEYAVALEIEAAAIAETRLPSRRWPSLSAKEILPLDLSWLHFAITGLDPHARNSKPRYVHNPFTDRDEWRAFEAVAEFAEFECLVDQEPTWVYELPPELVDELAAIADVPPLAAKWAELRAVRAATAGELGRALHELRELARVANAQRKSILLRVSI
jgi:hypothetical protein